MADTDSDGFLSEQEMQNLVVASVPEAQRFNVRAQWGEVWPKLLPELDTNGDDKVEAVVSHLFIIASLGAVVLLCVLTVATA